MALELREKYKDYVSYYGYSLVYDTYNIHFIDESDSKVEFHFIADSYPDEIDEKCWIKNGFYSIKVIDIPVDSRAVTLYIRIQKWINKETKQRLNSPVPFIDEKHGITLRALDELKDNIKVLPSKDIQSRFGITESYVSMISKEITKEEIANLEYLKFPNKVQYGYIRKEKLGNTPFYMFFIINKGNRTISLAEWERTSNKLLNVISKYTSLSLIYINVNLGDKFFKLIRDFADVFPCDVQFDILNEKTLPYNYIEERNWRNLSRLSIDIYTRINLITLKLANNRLTAKKNMYRIIYGNLHY